MLINWDLLIATLSLIVAAISIIYTMSCNRRKIGITDCIFHIDKTNANPPIARFKIYNFSPVVTTVVSIGFYTVDGTHFINTIDHKPVEGYEDYLSPFCRSAKRKVELTPLDYPHRLTSFTYIPPHSSIEFAYHFKDIHPEMMVKVLCKERIHIFKREQSFILNFTNDAN